MSNQGSGLHFLLNGMLTKQEKTETNTVKLTFFQRPFSAKVRIGGLPKASREEPEGIFSTAGPHQDWAPTFLSTSQKQSCKVKENGGQPNREGAQRGNVTLQTPGQPEV